MNEFPPKLINAKITHVSYVDKADDAQCLVYGIVYEPNVADARGDYLTPAENEKVAHGFLKDALEIDKQHDFHGGVGEVVESYIAPSDFEMGDEVIKKGSLVLVAKASDEI